MKDEFLDLCSHEITLGIHSHSARIKTERRGGSGSALFCFIVEVLEISVIMDRGEITCSFAATDSEAGSVFLSQIASRYDGNFGKEHHWSVAQVFQFIRQNMTNLIADFTSLKTGNIPPRLDGVQFTPPLHVLSKIAKDNLAKANLKTSG